MSYFKRHVFFCTNQRSDGEPCCQQFEAKDARAYTKLRAKSLGIHGPGGVRVNSAGCLDRCDKGPVLVVYPEAVWYTYVDREDLDEIIERHLVAGQTVERLRV